MDKKVQFHTSNNFKKSWKETNNLNLRPSRPMCVAGMSKPHDIVNAFPRNLKVNSLLQRGSY